MKRKSFVATMLLAILLGASTSSWAQRQDPDWDRSHKPPAPKQYKADAKTLYGVGISERAFNEAGDIRPLGTTSIGPAFPNKCFLGGEGWEVTLSDPFVRHYTARGFSVQSICLAVTAGGWIKYDIETGKALRTVGWYLIDIPNCFKNGVPLLECSFNYEYQFGLKATETFRRNIRERAVAADKDIRAVIASGKFSKPCGCDDLEIKKGKTGPQGATVAIADVRLKSGGYAPVPPALKFSCKADSVPECARKWLRGRDLSGWPLYELEGGVYFDGTSLKGGTDYGPFDISTVHPRGYAYRIGSPEGDDDRPFLELAPGTKLNVAE